MIAFFVLIIVSEAFWLQRSTPYDIPVRALSLCESSFAQRIYDYIIGMNLIRNLVSQSIFPLFHFIRKLIIPFLSTLRRILEKHNWRSIFKNASQKNYWLILSIRIFRLIFNY